MKHLMTILAGFLVSSAWAATVQDRYYGHEAVHDAHGVIAPWYRGLNGQCDLRVRIAAETLKRYPWTTATNAIAVYPHYVFTGHWKIANDGMITPLNTIDWHNGDLGQRATSVLNGFVDYYRYTGDPAAIAHVTYMANYVLDHCVTADDHPWPGLFISVPTKGKTYRKADPTGMIQLDIIGSTGEGLLRAYQIAGNARWLEAAKHWADVLAAKCNLDPGADPWPRYANPENVKWGQNKLGNKQTSGATMIVRFLDEVIRLGYTGKANAIVAARDAGRRYLRDKLLPVWWVNDTWGRYFWDWEDPVQSCLITSEVARYILDHKADFPNWGYDSRNILTLFFNHTSVSPASNGDVYSGAWAYPESSSCCGRSLWYGPMIHAPAFAQYAVETGDAWMRELAYRQMVLQTYDVHETGVSEDNIDGGTIVNGAWFNIAHPLPLRFVLAGIGWLPEEVGANRENHIVRSTAVVNSVSYGDGRIEYTTFDAPADTTEVLRLAFVPKTVTADGKRLERRASTDANGYAVKELPNGDAIVFIRHDGFRKVVVLGDDPQQVIEGDKLACEGEWRREATLHVTETAGATFNAAFTGNQVRLIGRAEPSGGLADVYVDGVKQLVHVDCWNPSPRSRQVLYYKNGLAQGAHTLKVVARGEHNPYSSGNRVCVDAVQFSAADKACGYPSGTGPVEVQRMVFGCTGEKDYRDSQGHSWRPATEFVTRTGASTDSVVTSWWLTPATNAIGNTSEPELYRYGVYGRDFWVNLTVGPGKYYVRLKFAAARETDTQQSSFDIRINGRRVVERLDVAATAGGLNRAADLVFNDIAPRNGIIEVRLTSARATIGGKLMRGEAFVQALEIGPGDGGSGVAAVSAAPAPPPSGNLLLNPGFEETVGGMAPTRRLKSAAADWTYEFAGTTRSYIWQEADYIKHPQWGLPEFQSGKGALRTHSDGDGHTMIHQDVEVAPKTDCTASVWVRAADLHGKGFGRDPRDSAGFVVWELDEAGKVVHKHPKIEVKKAGPYQQLTTRFTTGASTAQVRFVLDTVIRCPYQEGHVTYDDCSLAPEPPR
ncbi:MAG: malectin domain-containing carbohydrate-binding protein [Verrucomicrobia bacterium]|nr:malectin domain-containing carbohydrate-binding protein [Verrucomicrobiota bacterium]